MSRRIAEYQQQRDPILPFIPPPFFLGNQLLGSVDEIVAGLSMHPAVIRIRCQKFRPPGFKAVPLPVSFKQPVKIHPAFYCAFG